MPNYFEGCRTSEELKARYRKQAMRFHPDKGGSNSQFRELNEQYEQIGRYIERQPDLPVYFHKERDYEYFRSKVVYRTRNNHYYIFDRPNGATIMIDRDHLNLIWDKSKSIY